MGKKDDLTFDDAPGQSCPQVEYIPEGDIELNCADCRQPFILTEREQGFYRSKGLFIPKRCEPCRKARRERNEAMGRC